MTVSLVVMLLLVLVEVSDSEVVTEVADSEDVLRVSVSEVRLVVVCKEIAAALNVTCASGLSEPCTRTEVSVSEDVIVCVSEVVVAAVVKVCVWETCQAGQASRGHQKFVGGKCKARVPTHRSACDASAGAHRGLRFYSSGGSC